MGVSSSKDSRTITTNADYGHWILNNTYNSIIREQPIQHTLSKIERMFDLCSFDSVLWTRKDRVPEDLSRVCPTVFKYIKEQKQFLSENDH
jgi:hypothetical protein